jgi:ATP-dependent helicase STH1/SNF2
MRSDTARGVLAWHADSEARERRLALQRDRMRLRALKANDEEGYMRLVQATKNDRIKKILDQTDGFLQNMFHLMVRLRVCWGGRR